MYAVAERYLIGLLSLDPDTSARLIDHDPPSRNGNMVKRESINMPLSGL